jgi:chromate transporter
VPELAFGPVLVALPDLATLRPLPACIALGAAVALLWRHWPLSHVLLLSALAGALAALV